MMASLPLDGLLTLAAVDLNLGDGLSQSLLRLFPNWRPITAVETELSEIFLRHFKNQSDTIICSIPVIYTAGRVLNTAYRGKTERDWREYKRFTPKHLVLVSSRGLKIRGRSPNTRPSFDAPLTLYVNTLTAQEYPPSLSLTRHKRIDNICSSHVAKRWNSQILTRSYRYRLFLPDYLRPDQTLPTKHSNQNQSE